MVELVAVGTHHAEFLLDGAIVVAGGLEPGSTTELHGLTVTTLPSIGEVRSRIATANDVHFGEVECGKIDGHTPGQFASLPGEDPYPLVMNRSVIADIARAGVDAVVVKGDLTAFGTDEEYAAFTEHWVGAFGASLTYVRGNHDSYPGGTYADWPVQVRDVEGLRVVLLDTSRHAIAGGRLDAAQLAELDVACAATTNTVLVMGHHPIDLVEVPADGHACLDRSDSLALCEVMAAHANVVAYTAGHTHRNRRIDVDGIAMVEVAAVKDFPGAWAEYVVGTEGIAQIVHRASAPQALRWAERTRGMFDGLYGPYALGSLADRCSVLPLRR